MSLTHLKYTAGLDISENSFCSSYPAKMLAKAGPSSERIATPSACLHADDVAKAELNRTCCTVLHQFPKYLFWNIGYSETKKRELQS